jgi:hypothetical protein
MAPVCVGSMLVACSMIKMGVTVWWMKEVKIPAAFCLVLKLWAVLLPWYIIFIHFIASSDETLHTYMQFPGLYCG